MSCCLYWHLIVWIIHVSSGCKRLVQFGGKNITSVFLRAVVSLGCSTHCSINSKNFVFFAPIWWSSCTWTPQKWLRSSMNCNLLCIWWGDFLHFWSSGVYCTCLSPVEVISVCHQPCNQAEQLISCTDGKWSALSVKMCDTCCTWTGQHYGSAEGWVTSP